MLSEHELAIEQIDDQLMPEGYEPELLRLDPVWDSLDSHPRFRALLEKCE
jgi:hypothetical protein